MITFAIICHDEADSVARVVDQARVAATPGDVVLVVDSASTDGTAAAARAAGAQVLPAPLGKGAAMAEAWARLTTDWICFLDGDLTASERNIPAALADAVRRQGAAHVVGDFTCGLGTVLTLTDGFYRPLVGALFPEVAGAFGSKPLTGFRALRADAVVPPLPTNFGVESHLNITSTLRGGRPLVVDLGSFTGKLKVNPARTTEVTGTILDRAEEHGRLDRGQRPAWEDWVDRVLAVAMTWDPDADQRSYGARLLRAAARPLPEPHRLAGADRATIQARSVSSRAAMRSAGVS